MKTLVIFYPGCIEFEVLLACEMLNKNFPVIVATPDGKDHRGSSGITFRPSLAFENVDPQDYKVILCPGGDPGTVIGNKELIRIIQSGHLKKTILAAICAGPIILEQARVLDNRLIAHGYAGAQKEWLLNNGYFKSTKLTDEQIVIDENIITAKPCSYIDFAVEIAILSGCIDRVKGETLKKYYKGLN